MYIYLMYKYIFRSNIWSNIESHYFAPSFPRGIVSELRRGQPDVQGWSVASFPGKNSITWPKLIRMRAHCCFFAKAFRGFSRVFPLIS